MQKIRIDYQFFELDCKRNVSKSMYPKNVQETSLDVFLTFVCVDRVWGALIYFLRDSHWLTCTLMNKWKETTWVAAVIFRHASSDGDRKIFKPCFINWWPHHEWKKVKLSRALKIEKRLFSVILKRTFFSGSFSERIFLAQTLCE